MREVSVLSDEDEILIKKWFSFNHDSNWLQSTVQTVHLPFFTFSHSRSRSWPTSQLRNVYACSMYAKVVATALSMTRPYIRTTIRVSSAKMERQTVYRLERQKHTNSLTKKNGRDVCCGQWIWWPKLHVSRMCVCMFFGEKNGVPFKRESCCCSVVILMPIVSFSSLPFYDWTLKSERECIF